MSVSNAISAHVPYLRRFSRALTGTQAGGDAYVLATLETLVAEPGSLRTRGLARRPLSAVPQGLGIDAGQRLRRSSAVFRRRKRRPAQSRGNSTRAAHRFPSQRARKFQCRGGCPHPRLLARGGASLIDRAGKEISKQIRTDVLIIEDEPLIAIDIQMLVEELGPSCRRHRPYPRRSRRGGEIRSAGLILADIQLADGSSGLDAVNQILGNFELPVIFITAYPERFLTGTPPEPAFLITKPFGIDSLKAVISQALFFDRKSYHKAPPDQKAALV